MDRSGWTFAVTQEFAGVSEEMLRTLWGLAEPLPDFSDRDDIERWLSS